MFTYMSFAASCNTKTMWKDERQVNEEDDEDDPKQKQKMQTIPEKGSEQARIKLV